MDVILGIVAYSVVLGFIAGALFWLLRERGPPDGGDDGGGAGGWDGI